MEDAPRAVRTKNKLNNIDICCALLATRDRSRRFSHFLILVQTERFFFTVTTQKMSSNFDLLSISGSLDIIARLYRKALKACKSQWRNRRTNSQKQTKRIVKSLNFRNFKKPKRKNQPISLTL